MKGYDAGTYGRSFADVYDDWFADLGDLDPVLDRVEALAAGGRALELGVGTGRIAGPLASRGVATWGLDASPEMLEQLADRPGGERVHSVVADMAQFGLTGFSVVFVAFNTFFNLPDLATKRSCLASVAAALEPGGSFLVETVVPPGADEGARSGVEPRTIEVDRVVLSASVHDPHRQTMSGQYIELGPEVGVRLRPWHLHYVRPPELDALAHEAGLELVERTENWAGDPYGPTSPTQVAHYRRSAARASGPGDPIVG